MKILPAENFLPGSLITGNLAAENKSNFMN